MFNNDEIPLAIITDADHPRTARGAVDARIQADQSELSRRYSTYPAQIGLLTTSEPRNSLAVRIVVPVGGCVVYE